MNIKFCYLYRDSSNYKNFNHVVFSNPKHREVKEIESIVREKLIDDKWFYSAKWKIPDMHFKEFVYSSEIDVDWHEFEAIEPTLDEVTESNSIEDFLVLIKNTNSNIFLTKS